MPQNRSGVDNGPAAWHKAPSTLTFGRPSVGIPGASTSSATLFSARCPRILRARRWHVPKGLLAARDSQTDVCVFVRFRLPVGPTKKDNSLSTLQAPSAAESTSVTFADLGLDPRLLRAIDALGHTTPTAIQAKAIGPAVAGRDVLGVAQTGTGKTGSFALPLLHRLATHTQNYGRHPRALVLAPTRELAAQICEAARGYARHINLRCGLLIGGVSMGPQEQMLRRGIDLLVATPGRLKDHLERRSVSLGNVEILVFDEADRMLDMGFIRDVRTIVRYVPRDHQSLLFSATLPQSILGLAKELLHEPVRVEVASQSSTPKSVQQTMVSVAASDKRPALLALLSQEAMVQTIIFARTKHGADKLGRFLDDHGHRTVTLHGNKSQSQRQLALHRFKKAEASVLVATDIAARGIDVTGVSHVVNFDLPQAAEDYVHRIGRTGRAQAKGVAISLVAPEERSMLRSIERLTGVAITRTVLEGFNQPTEYRPSNPRTPPPRRPRRRFAA